MSSHPSGTVAHPPSESWHTFPKILGRLHQQGIYIHPHQLAEFMLVHGLPVDLDYVPLHLREKATMVNAHYQGDMARLEVSQDEACYLEAIF